MKLLKWVGFAQQWHIVRVPIGLCYLHCLLLLLMVVHLKAVLFVGKLLALVMERLQLLFEGRLELPHGCIRLEKKWRGLEKGGRRREKGGVWREERIGDSWVLGLSRKGGLGSKLLENVCRGVGSWLCQAA